MKKMKILVRTVSMYFTTSLGWGCLARGTKPTRVAVECGQRNYFDLFVGFISNLFPCPPVFRRCTWKAAIQATLQEIASRQLGIDNFLGVITIYAKAKHTEYLRFGRASDLRVAHVLACVLQRKEAHTCFCYTYTLRSMKRLTEDPRILVAVRLVSTFRRTSVWDLDRCTLVRFHRLLDWLELPRGVCDVTFHA